MLYSGFQSPEFHFPEAKFPGFRILQAKSPRPRNPDSLPRGEMPKIYHYFTLGTVASATLSDVQSSVFDIDGGISLYVYFHIGIRPVMNSRSAE